MVKRLLLIMLILGLVGCATPGDLAKMKPIAEFDSSRSAKDYAICVSSKWALHRADVNTITTEDGYMVTLPHPFAGCDVAAFVTNKDDGCHVKLAGRLPYSAIGWPEDVIKECR